MRTFFLACNVGLIAALSAGCGDGAAPAETSGTSASSSGTGETGGTGGGSGGTGGEGGATATSGTTGSGGSGGAGGAGGTPGDPTTGTWQGGFGLPGVTGFGARVSAMVHGTGNHVFVGGIFDDAAGTPASNVAEWTGTMWQALDKGLPGPVNALAVGADGALYAGGTFATNADPTNHLARWDGQTWTLLPGDIDGAIKTLGTLGDHLLVGGDFMKIAGASTAGIATYDAQGFHAIGGAGTDGGVASILVGDAASFCIGGLFANVDGVAAANAACWNGTAWSQLGDGLPGAVARLVRSPQGDYYAGGTLTYMDFNTGAYQSGLAVLKGATWQPFAGGVDGGFINEVRALAFADDGDLLVGGSFATVDSANPVGADNMARYDFGGTGWSVLGGGATNDVGFSIGSVVGINDILLMTDGSPLVGGLFSTLNHGQLQAANIALLGDKGPTPLVNSGHLYQGVGGFIDNLDMDATGHLIAAGGFHAIGGLITDNIARLGDKGWEAIGGGVDDVVYSLHVRPGGDILVGGLFSHAGSVYAPYLARFNGTFWSQFGPGFDGQVNAIIEDTQGNVYVGGDFVNTGNGAASHVARWNGSVWSALGEGVDDRVTALALDKSGNLIATGLFHQSGSVVLNGLGAWDGMKWTAFGTGLDGTGGGYGSTLVAQGAGFLVGGAFNSVDGHPLSGVARWDGSQWTGLGEGLATASGYGLVVSHLAVYGDGVFATGTFDASGSTQLGHLGWWDGAAWHALGAGIDDIGEALLPSGNKLWTGGTFLHAGGQVSTGIGRWDFGP
jgi:trimeric autotransporter adhesin